DFQRTRPALQRIGIVQFDVFPGIGIGRSFRFTRHLEILPGWSGGFQVIQRLSAGERVLEPTGPAPESGPGIALLVAIHRAAAMATPGRTRVVLRRTIGEAYPRLRANAPTATDRRAAPAGRLASQAEILRRKVVICDRLLDPGRHSGGFLLAQLCCFAF